MNNVYNLLFRISKTKFFGTQRLGKFDAIPLPQTPKKHYDNKKGYLAYQKLRRSNTKTRNLFDKLKDTYVITVSTDHTQCSEPPDTIITCANCNRITIQNFTSVYQMKLCTVISALIISRRPFTFIKVYRSSDQIDYLVCNQCEVHLSDKDTDKENGP